MLAHETDRFGWASLGAWDPADGCVGVHATNGMKLRSALIATSPPAHNGSLPPSLPPSPMPLPQHLEKEHQEKTKVKNIQTVELGRHEMDTW